MALLKRLLLTEAGALRRAGDREVARHARKVAGSNVRADFDVVFLFGNQAMGLGVDTGTALYCDRGNAAYAEYLVSRSTNGDGSAIRTLALALNSESTREFITTAYAGALVPAF